MRFSDYVILGTHDSGASMGLMERQVKPFSKAFVCQIKNISEQFDMGVRFFDLRINDDLDLIHGESLYTFGRLADILDELEQKVKSCKSFAIVSLKFDSKRPSAGRDLRRLRQLVSTYQEFSNGSQASISGMYLFSRIKGLSGRCFEFKDDSYTNLRDLYIQDCYKFTNLLLPEWRDKWGAIKECDAYRFNGVKMNFTSFIKGSFSTRWNPMDTFRDMMSVYPEAVLVNIIPNPLRCAEDINPRLIRRASSEFRSNIYVVDGVYEDLADRFSQLRNFLR